MSSSNRAGLADVDNVVKNETHSVHQVSGAGADIWAEEVSKPALLNPVWLNSVNELKQERTKTRGHVPRDIEEDSEVENSGK